MKKETWGELKRKSKRRIYTQKNRKERYTEGKERKKEDSFLEKCLFRSLALFLMGLLFWGVDVEFFKFFLNFEY